MSLVPGSQGTVLFVEDDATFRRVLEGAMSEAEISTRKS